MKVGGAGVRRSRVEARLAAVLAEAVRGLNPRVGEMADALLPGDRITKLGGGGVEVVGVREYHPGDEVRAIDWRVTARRGRLHVKEFAQERDFPVMVALLRSPGLGGGRGGIREIRALEAAALLGALALREGQPAGLVQLRGGEVDRLPPRRGRNQLPLFLAHLLKSPGSVEEHGGLALLLEEVRRICGERSRVFLVGAPYLDPWTPSPLRPLLRSLVTRHAATAVRIRDRGEGALPPGAAVLLRDPVRGVHLLHRREGNRLGMALLRAEREWEGFLREVGLEEWVLDVEESLPAQLQQCLSGGAGVRRV